ncbi:MAG: enoyl-CoA hydratase-related protein [Deferrisomatales bacterium]|nr:enoyl-CoA hydratase-related protein [Deferrisomatales bacterium]
MAVTSEIQGKVAHITIDRQNYLNALNREVFEELQALWVGLEADRDITVVVLTGAGEKAFVAGADVGELLAAGARRPELVRRGQEFFLDIHRSAKVVIAAVNGYALGGGCELALACDLRLASESAKFGLPEGKLGVMPGYGGTQLLARLIGPGRAKFLLFSGEMVSAREAWELGLVEKVYPSTTFRKEVGDLAQRISRHGPLALQAVKRAVNRGLERPLEDALEIESEEYRGVALSQDAENGLAAFLEKKPVVFTGT